MALVKPREAFFHLLRRGGWSVRRLSSAEGPKSLVRLGFGTIQNHTSRFDESSLMALNCPVAATTVPMEVIAPNYQDVSPVPAKIVSALNIKDEDDPITGSPDFFLIYAELKKKPLGGLTPALKLCSTVFAGKSNDEKVVQLLAQLIFTKLIPDQYPGFIVVPQPSSFNRLSLEFGEGTPENPPFTLTSIVDVSILDTRHHPPSVVMFGSVEVKDPRNKKDGYPQLVGQLIGQAAHNYRAGVSQPDGSYCGYAVVFKGFRVWFYRASFDKSFFEACAEDQIPPIPPVINVWGGQDQQSGAKLLHKEERQVIFNLINARGAEVFRRNKHKT